uniref:Putative secreted peptide n=1 Tax=Anopheles braziliensis TaxID=58242 RepID=A0A2M3ZP39_9DIPT
MRVCFLFLLLRVLFFVSFVNSFRMFVQLLSCDQTLNSVRLPPPAFHLLPLIDIPTPFIYFISFDELQLSYHFFQRFQRGSRSGSIRPAVLFAVLCFTLSLKINVLFSCFS